MATSVQRSSPKWMSETTARRMREGRARLLQNGDDSESLTSEAVEPGHVEASHPDLGAAEHAHDPRPVPPHVARVVAREQLPADDRHAGIGGVPGARKVGEVDEAVRTHLEEGGALPVQDTAGLEEEALEAVGLAPPDRVDPTLVGEETRPVQSRDVALRIAPA